MACTSFSFKNPILFFAVLLLLTSSRCSKEDEITTSADPIDQQTDDTGNQGDDPVDDPDIGGFTEVVSIVPSGIEEGYFFGYDIAATSEFTAVSAPWHDEKGNRVGAVYIFRRNGSEFEGTAHVLYPDSPTFEDHYGWSIALSGTTLVVGAPENDKHGENAGLVFIYEHIGNNQWNLVKELEAPNPQEGQEFGYAVAIDNGTVAIGSRFDSDNYYDEPPFTNNAGIAQGSVFVYGQASNWDTAQKLVPLEEQGHRWDAFGTALALDGETLAIGAKGTDNIYVDPGSVYIFGNIGGSWVQQTRIEASDGRRENFFGAAIALDGNDLAVTAPGSFNSLLPNSDVPHGAAYVFSRSGDDWSEDLKILAADTKPEDGFGEGDIALHNDYLVVGAPLKKVVTNYNGTAYFFERAPGWAESHMITAPDPLNEDSFGSALATTEDMIFVGAHRRCNETGCWAGALYFVQ